MKKALSVCILLIFLVGSQAGFCFSGPYLMRLIDSSGMPTPVITLVGFLLVALLFAWPIALLYCFRVLMWLRRTWRRVGVTAMKFNCPTCHGGVSDSHHDGERRVECPSCRATIEFPVPKGGIIGDPGNESLPLLFPNDSLPFYDHLCLLLGVLQLACLMMLCMVITSPLSPSGWSLVAPGIANLAGLIIFGILVRSIVPWILVFLIVGLAALVAYGALGATVLSLVGVFIADTLARLGVALYWARVNAYWSRVNAE